MNANRTANHSAAATVFAAVVLAVLTLAPVDAAAPAPEAYIGTFMPHGLEGRDYLDNHLSRIQRAMESCYDEALRVAPSTSGMMLTRIFLDRAGNVTDVAVMNNQTGNTALAGCVEEAVADVRFSATQSDNASITVPVTFRVRAHDVAVDRR